MEILVCIKQVPGTTSVEVDPVTGVLKRDGIEAKMNPYDLYALELGLELGARTDGHVSVITMGPDQAREVLLEAVCMGAERGYLISDRCFAGADVCATSHTLSQGIRQSGTYDLILCGKQTKDGDTAQVGAETAEFLGIAHGANILEVLETGDTFVTVRMNLENRIQIQKMEHPTGTLVHMDVKEGFLDNRIQVLGCTPKEKLVDISEADIIVAVGRGVKSQADLELMGQLGAQMACTRPLVENGWFDPRQQIGLSGRTVKPKLIITAGISGSVQFAAGMKGADCIIAVNRDKKASIFDVAHYGIVGDLYEIIPELIRQLKGELE